MTATASPYNVPRRPIGAMYSSPGPCYNLPGLVGYQHHDPRSVHFKGPGWYFGVRHGKYANDSSPGPCYFPQSKLYRNGMDGSPHYSLYSRPKSLSMDYIPGPGAYKPETTINKIYNKAPEYPFGIRHIDRKTDNTPGPNVYAIDPMLGKTIRSQKPAAPIYSMTSRSKVGGFHEDLKKTPGPGNYSVTHPSIYKSRPPQYSLTSRNMMPNDNTRKPGPGAYSNETVTMNRKSAPCITFGIRHSQYKGEMIVQNDID